jgi:hypothetical protein
MSLDFSLNETRTVEIFTANITHNLVPMAMKAGLYCLWHPMEEVGATQASRLIPFLEKGIQYMKDHKEELEELNPPNGWGDYKGLLRFAENVLANCKLNPSATIAVDR